VEKSRKSLCLSFPDSNETRDLNLDVHFVPYNSFIPVNDDFLLTFTVHYDLLLCAQREHDSHQLSRYLRISFSTPWFLMILES
jgi:hypothetical protein